MSRRIRASQAHLRQDDKKDLAEGLRDTYAWSGERETGAAEPSETELGEEVHEAPAPPRTAEPSTTEAFSAEEAEAEGEPPVERLELEAALAPAAPKPEEEKAQEARSRAAEEVFRLHYATRLPEEQVLVVIRVQGPEAAIQTSEEAAKEPAGPTRPAAEKAKE